MISPSISIIIPVYNAERTLTHCIESVISQSFTDWELILVNDGSQDGSGALCDSYARKDSRIEVYHKINGGVSSARNMGIENSTGTYVTFIDSDDYVDHDFLERMIDSAPLDLIICGFRNEGSISFQPMAGRYNLKENKDFIKILFDTPYYLDTPWGKLFRSDIIQKNSIRFNTAIRLSEDTLFCYQYVSKIQSVEIISLPLYHYDGIWGGGLKYHLTLDQQSYMSECITDAIKNVNCAFNVEIEDLYRGFHPSKILNVYTNYRDVSIYELYIKFYNRISIGEFMGNGNSPLIQGIIKSISLATMSFHVESVKLLTDIRTFTTTPVSQIKFSSKKIMVICWILQYLGPHIAHWVISRTPFKKLLICNE